MRSLFEISKDYLAALDAATDPDSDINPEMFKDTLDGIQEEGSVKSINIAKIIVQIDAEADAIQAAENNMRRRRQALEKKAVWLRDYLLENMQKADLKEAKSPEIAVKLVKNGGKLPLKYEPEFVPDTFKRIRMTEEVDTDAIRKILEAGEVLSWASLGERGYHLKIG
jgi:restriction endonuclease S subunit